MVAAQRAHPAPCRCFIFKKVKFLDNVKEDFAIVYRNFDLADAGKVTGDMSADAPEADDKAAVALPQQVGLMGKQTLIADCPAPK